MPLLLADKVNHLTAARYFAARGFDWLFYDLPDDQPGSIAKIMAIREWVEGPGTGLFLPMGWGNATIHTLEHIQPNAVIAGHFAPLEPYPSDVTLFKEWQLSPSAEMEDLIESIQSWTQAHHHLLRVETLSPQDLAVLTSLLQPLGASHSLIFSPSLSSALSKDWLDYTWISGYCFRVGEEDQTGLLSFEELDEILDILEDQ